jgi:hypothetical protein
MDLLELLILKKKLLCLNGKEERLFKNGLGGMIILLEKEGRANAVFIR